jgi:hypothetical protein
MGSGPDSVWLTDITSLSKPLILESKEKRRGGEGREEKGRNLKILLNLHYQPGVVVLLILGPYPGLEEKPAVHRQRGKAI